MKKQEAQEEAKLAAKEAQENKRRAARRQTQVYRENNIYVPIGNLYGFGYKRNIQKKIVDSNELQL